MRKLAILTVAALITAIINIAPAMATENVQVDRKLSQADATSSINLQCGSGGVPTFTARIDTLAKVINITFTDGDTDSAIILGEKNGILYSRTTEGALLAFRGDQWALSVDGGKSAVAGGTCRQMTRV